MLHALVFDCIKSETDLGLGNASLIELKRYLIEFADYCKSRLKNVTDVTPLFLKDYIDIRCKNTGPSVVKAVVWSLRKFGAHLRLRQIVPKNPAQPLCHPKFPTRKELPAYLNTIQLRTLLTTAAKKTNQRDFAVLSLMVSTGLRPGDMARLKREDFDPVSQSIKGVVKGYWVKQTPLNTSITSILQNYLKTRTDSDKAFFVTDRGRPLTVSWIQRRVKEAGKDAELTIPLTCNCLRHSFATHSADRHKKTITRSLLGHQDVRTTEVYTHLSPRRFKPLMNLHPYVRSIRRVNS